MKLFTDGSVLENGHVGAGYVIPSLKIRNTFHLGNKFSIFTAELIAILMVLTKLSDLKFTHLSIVVCVDSKSVLEALQSEKYGERGEIIYEIHHIIHSLIVNGILVSFCWVPSHCGLLYNEWADRAAKDGANNNNSYKLNINLSKREMKHALTKNVYKKLPCHILFENYSLFPRPVARLAHRLALNSWKTKYCAEVTCICNRKITIQHLIHDCNAIKPFLVDITKQINYLYWIRIAQCLIQSPIGNLL